MHDIGLYVHIPFCRHKCNYCSFASYQSRETDIVVYLCALKAELAQRAGGRPIRSIYFGGGTPSLLSPEQIGDILATIDSLSAVNEAAEITIEANPGFKLISTAGIFFLKNHLTHKINDFNV